MPIEKGTGDLTGAHHTAPQTDERRLGRFFPDEKAAWATITALEIPLVEDADALFAQAAERAKARNEHLMIFHGGHVGAFAMSGLVIKDNLHRIPTDMSEDYAYITTAEEVAQTMLQDRIDQQLHPESLLHVLSAAAQEIGTAEEIAIQVATLSQRRRGGAFIAAYRPSIDQGLQTGESMQELLSLAGAMGFVDEVDETYQRLYPALEERVAHVKDHVAAFDSPSH